MTHTIIHLATARRTVQPANDNAFFAYDFSTQPSLSPGEIVLQTIIALRSGQWYALETNYWASRLLVLTTNNPNLFFRGLRCPQGESLEDIVQDVLLKILRNPDSFAGQHPGEAFKWFGQIIRRHVFDLAKRADALRKLVLTSLSQEHVGDDGSTHTLMDCPPERLVTIDDFESAWKLQMLERVIDGQLCHMTEAQARNARFYLDHEVHGATVAEQLLEVLGRPPESAVEQRKALNIVYQRRRLGQLAIERLLGTPDLARAW